MDSGYFYGGEAGQFTFYRMLKMLFTDERFRSIFAKAKILYGMLLDRMSLSVKNDRAEANAGAACSDDGFGEIFLTSQMRRTVKTGNPIFGANALLATNPRDGFSYLCFEISPRSCVSIRLPKAERIQIRGCNGGGKPFMDADIFYFLLFKIKILRTLAIPENCVDAQIQAGGICFGSPVLTHCLPQGSYRQ